MHSSARFVSLVRISRPNITFVQDAQLVFAQLPFLRGHRTRRILSDGIFGRHKVWSIYRRRAWRALRKLAEDEAPGVSSVLVTQRDDTIADIVERAEESDLLILGLQRLRRRQKYFGKLVLEIARRTTCPLLMISRRR